MRSSDARAREFVGVTGHRPDKLGGYDAAARSLATRFAVAGFDVASGPVATGMALGWDQAVARACVRMGIPFVAAVPFEGFDRMWPAPARERLESLLNRAARVVVVSKPQSFSRASAARALQRRNEWIVDRSRIVLALWNGSRGGTANAIRYAEQTSVPVANLWERWQSWKAANGG